MDDIPAAAIARLEEQVKQLAANAARGDLIQERILRKLDLVDAKLNQASGGAAVLKYFGLGTFGGVLAFCATIYAMVHGFFRP